jgi:hypothetical protein
MITLNRDNECFNYRIAGIALDEDQNLTNKESQGISTTVSYFYL